MRENELQRIESELSIAAFSETVAPGTDYGGSVGFERPGGAIMRWEKPNAVRITVPLGGEDFVFDLQP